MRSDEWWTESEKSWTFGQGGLQQARPMAEAWPKYMQDDFWRAYPGSDLSGSVLVVNGDLRLLLPERQTPGRQLALGIRPQHLEPVAEGSPGSVPVTVRFSEPLGEETDLTLDGPGGIELLARLRLDVQPPAGEPMALGFQSDMVHLFDHASGERVN